MFPPEWLPMEMYTLASAAMFCALTRSRDLEVLIRKKSQRTTDERKSVSRGLLRSVVLDFLLFVPASCVLVLLILAPFLLGVWKDYLALNQFETKVTSHQLNVAAYSALGVLSYGFPVVGLRSVITRIALSTLKEFASISHSGNDREKATAAAGGKDA